MIDAVRIGPGPAGPLLTTTPQGALELLTRLLPRGRPVVMRACTAAGGPRYAVRPDLPGPRRGPGMLRLAVYRDGLGGDPAPGTVELTEAPGNCVQNQMVTVHHRDGLQVDLMISTCLAWDGRGDLAGTARPRREGGDRDRRQPDLGTQIPAEYVVNGAKRFSTLGRTNG
ncbi:hypothetical protein NKG94_01370 [Micromonospora sp. M12]